MKKVPAKNKGLKKLPKAVRNKMGFMKNGGKVKKKKGYKAGGKVTPRKMMNGGAMKKKMMRKGGAAKSRR